jgi:hypothetical protein
MNHCFLMAFTDVADGLSEHKQFDTRIGTWMDQLQTNGSNSLTFTNTQQNSMTEMKSFMFTNGAVTLR